MTDETPATTADEVRAEIDQTRTDLAQTVDALQDKLDVKAQAKTKVQEALDKSAAALGPAAEKAKPYRSQIGAGAAAFLFLVMLVRRRKRSRSE